MCVLKAWLCLQPHRALHDSGLVLFPNNVLCNLSTPMRLRSRSIISLKPWDMVLSEKISSSSGKLANWSLSCYINCNKVTFSVTNTEAPVSHVAVWVEDDRHDIPRRGELWRGDVTAKYPKEVPLILRYAVVDLDVVVSTVGMVLELKVMEGEEDGGTLCHHN